MDSFENRIKTSPEPTTNDTVERSTMVAQLPSQLRPSATFARKSTSRSSAKIDFKKLAGEAYSYSDDDNQSSASSSSEASNLYANRHIYQFLHRTFENDSTTTFMPTTSHISDVDRNVKSKRHSIKVAVRIQTVSNGSELTAQNLTDPNHSLSIHEPILITDTAASIGMKLPKGNGQDKHLTIREIGESIGMTHPISVMDVREQDELDGWNFGDMVEYFEDEDRKYNHGSNSPLSSPKHYSLGSSTSSPTTTKRKRERQQRRKKNQSLPRVLNQISLEFSPTPFAKSVKSPQFVRDLDWIDHVWPTERRMAGDYPRVQYYCLTSTSGCYTDFHVDFGGTSVWYHILSGEKVFILIPPTRNNLKLYEAWLCRKDQNDIFFPDMRSVDDVTGEEIRVESCVRTTLAQGQTFIIPSGYIHAVYTPQDSLVIGGNFLHGLDIKGQLNIHCLETKTRVPAKFRFPSFVQLMFYAGKEYLKRFKVPHGTVHREEVQGLKELVNALRQWVVPPGGDAREGSVAHVGMECVAELQSYGVTSVDEMLDALEEELLKTEEKKGIPPPVHKQKLRLCIKRKRHSSPTSNIDSAKSRNEETTPSQPETSSGRNERPTPSLKLKLKLSEPLISRIQKNAKVEASHTLDEDGLPDFDFSDNGSMKAPSAKKSKAGTYKKTADLVSKQNPVADDEWLPDSSVSSTAGTKPKIQKSSKLKIRSSSASAKSASVPKTTITRKKGGIRARLMKYR